MVQKLFNDIQREIDIRQNLSKLRQEIKQGDNKKLLYTIVKDCPAKVIGLLDSEDAKTRKNAALLMGDLGMDEFCRPLYDGYLTENQMFVKSAYLSALKSFDCRPFIAKFKKQIETLAATALTPETKKHVEAEMRALSDIVIQYETTIRHTFNGFNERYECILLTNRFHKSVTAEQITNGLVTPFVAGLKVTTNNIMKLLSIRTYSELLLVIPSIPECSMEPAAAAKQIADSNLIELLEKVHLEDFPFYFRIGLKSTMDLDKKSSYTKKISSELERLTNRKLINTTSSYELEIRMIENKSGSFNVLIKLNTIPDNRFDYRKESIAASIKPVNAALLVELSKGYMKKDAQVLDPFCGVGTMLIERQKVVKGNTSYGIDTFAEAITKGKRNMDAAGQIIHFVNRNFFEFEHDYLFDEIFTNMPFATGHKSQDEIYEIYEEFFPKSKELLTPEGNIIMYTHDRDYARLLSGKHGYKVVEEFEIMDKQGSYLMIMTL